MVSGVRSAAGGSSPIVLERGGARIVPPEPNRSVSVTRPLGEGGRPRKRKLDAGRFGEGGRKLRARADRELAVDAREVDFDRPLGDEERLRDLAVGGPFGRHLGDAPLAGGERLEAAQGDAPGTRAGGEELALGAGGEGRGAADRRQLERVPKLLARLRATVGSAKRRSQLGARLRVLELRRRVREHLDRFPKEREPLLATLDQSRRAQGCAERPRGTPGARKLELFARQPAGFVLLAELEQGEGGRRAPGDEGGVAAADRLEAATGVEHLLEAADQIAVQQAQARADVGEIEQARIIFGEGLADAGAGQR